MKVFTVGLILIGNAFNNNVFFLVLIGIQLLFGAWVSFTYCQILKETWKEYCEIKSEKMLIWENRIPLNPPIKLEGCGRYSGDIEFVCNECAVKSTYLCEKFRKHNKTHKITVFETVTIYL